MDETHLLSPDSTVADNNKSKKKNKNKKKKITQSRSKAKRYALITFEELPEYMKDNEYILNYYRANWPLKEALFSIVRWHNETLNVWTHLIGFVLFLGLTVANLMHMPQVRDFLSMFIRSFPMTADTNVSHNSKDIFLVSHFYAHLNHLYIHVHTHIHSRIHTHTHVCVDLFQIWGLRKKYITLEGLLQETTKLIDLKQTASPEMEIPSLETAAARWPFYIFLAGSMFCLLSSSICHLFSCHSHYLNLFLVRIDYIGITVMIITSFFPPIYYIFQCNTHWQFIYLTGITIMGTFTIVTMLSPSLSTSKYRPFRVFLFMAMGLFGIVPAIHGLIVNWNEPQQNITLAYESVMALCYMIGTIFYVSRIPERWKPGWFDLAGHSHQIFHVFVIFGALAHYGAALVFLEYGNKVGCGRSI
ncbi:hypothetical protein F0562_030164 [Nyssa sinensis]|uniref:Uncharacterized protein n=1 Tax=Nyssa sinensis TaxID=561372 RepID=A0A5J5B221_9ASTE|nr:hypothetical protein F0562_030164 [Nyssa sinensis]